MSLFPGASDAHDITETAARTMVAAYKNSLSGEEQKIPGILGGVFDVQAIQQILAQQDILGLRYYYGLDSSGNRNLILVATDADGDDSGFMAVIRERANKYPPHGGSF